MSNFNSEEQFKKIKEVPGGYSACGGQLDEGWYGGMLVLDSSTSALYNVKADKDYAVNLEHYRRMEQISINRPRRIMMMQLEDSNVLERELTAAIRIDGPACPKEQVEKPIIAWTERRSGGWELKLLYEEKIQTVIRQSGILRFPQVAATADGPILAIEVPGPTPDPGEAGIQRSRRLELPDPRINASAGPSSCPIPRKARWKTAPPPRRTWH